MAFVDWYGSSLNYLGAQRVYVRQRWADAWSYQGNIWCTDASWSLLPAMPTTAFELHYGKVLPHGSHTWVEQAKLNLGGWYIRVEFPCEDGTLLWVGFVDEIADSQGGASTVATGTQTFIAYAMPQVLASEVITSTRWWDQRNSVARASGSAITFNQGGKPNRTPTIKAGETTHIFQARDRRLDTAPSKPDFWSSRDIAQYLIKHAMPKDQAGAEKIKWRLDGASLIPNWDKPTIETEGRPVLSILEDLVNPSRLLQLSTTLDESTTPNTVVLTVNSLSSVALSLPNGETFAANSNPLEISTTAAHDTQILTQRSETATVNQVVVKGGLRESCGTYIIGTLSVFVEGWSSTDATQYEDAASGITGYSGLSDSDKKLANERKRAKPGMKDVYRTFDLNSNGLFINTTGGFVFSENDDSRYYPYWGSVQVVPQLPLKLNVDYSGSEVFTGAAYDVSKDVADYRQPYVLFKRPSSSPAKYIQAEKMANKRHDPLFSVAVGIENDGQSLTLDVNGAEQHAIAHGVFTPLDVDTTTAQLGSWEYYDTQLTLSLQEDRYAEAKYPADDSLPTRDVIRRKVFYAGPAYQLVTVLDETIVDVEDDGTEITSSGGLLIDDRDKLESLAMIAASWWLIPRQVLRLNSKRPSAVAAVGQLLTYANAGTPQAVTINTVVSEIRLSSQRGENDGLADVSYSLTTAMGEFDALAFAPPPPVVTPGQVTV